MKSIRWLRWARLAAVSVAVLALMLSAAASWLLCSEAGLRWSIATWLASHNETGASKIEISGLQGRLIGPVHVQHLEINSQDSHYAADGIALDWQAKALLERRLAVTRLSIDALTAISRSDEPITAPADLQLPAHGTLQIDAISVGKMEVLSGAGHLQVSDLQAALSSDGTTHRLEHLALSMPMGRLSGSGTIAATTPFALAASVEWRASGAERSDGEAGTRLLVDLRGSLLATTAETTLQRGAHALHAALGLAPFAAQPVTSLHVRGDEIAPRELLRQVKDLAGEALAATDVEALPDAAFTIDTELSAGSDGLLRGPMALDNHLPRPLDHHGWPFSTLRAQLAIDWRASTRRLQLDDMLVTIGDGSVSGRTDLVWPATEHMPRGTAAWQIKRIDAAQLHSALRTGNASQPSARYSGRLDFTGDAQEQQAVLLLSDGVRRLEATLQQRDEVLTFSRLALRQGQAELLGQGELKFNDTLSWRYHGSLRNFDPSVYVKAPPAALNADVDASGTVRPRLAGRLKFNLLRSMVADQSLIGTGDLSISGIAGKADIDNLIAANGKAAVRGSLQLRVQNSRIDAQGGWGGPDDTLKVVIDAPDLAQHRTLLPGIAGQLSLSATLGGFPAHTRLILDGHGRRLALPGGYAIGDFDTQARLVDESLRLSLSAAQLRGPEGHLLPSLDLQVDGTRTRHRLQFSVSLPEQRRLEVKASGSLRESQHDWRDTGWLGTIESARLHGKLSVVLAGPTTLEASRQRLALGDVTLRVADGSVRLSESYWSPERWATRGRFEQIALRLDGYQDNMAPPPARADGVWSLSGEHTGTLLGSLRATVPDLRGLGPAMDGNLTSAGELEIDASLAGSVQQPQLQGTINGRHLALGLIDQNVVLHEGTLAVRFQGAQAIIDRLTFTSPQDAPQRAARVTGFSPRAGAGTLDVIGNIDFAKRETHLQATLERLPLVQRAERWLVATGTARLDYATTGLSVVSRLTADAGFIAEQVATHPKLSSDIVVLGHESTPRNDMRLDSDITLDLGERFHLNAAGLSARLAGKINLRGDASETSRLRASGSIEAYDATFTAYGQSLTVERGIVNFQGALDDPGLNVLALRKGLAVEAGVTVSGTVQHPVVRLTSTPAVPDAEKLSWIVLGRASDATGTDASLLLAAAGTILGSEGQSVTRQVAQTLGLDDISLRRSTTGESLSDQILTVGKRLSARTYLSYEQGLASAGGALKLTHSLSRSLSLVTQAGENSAIDILYRFTFD